MQDKFNSGPKPEYYHEPTIIISNGKCYRTEGYRVPVKNSLYIRNSNGRVKRQKNNPDVQGPELKIRLIVVEVNVQNIMCFDVPKMGKPEWSPTHEEIKNITKRESEEQENVK